LCLTPNSIREVQLVMDKAPAWVRRCKFLLLQLHRLRALCHGVYWEKPFTYSIYTLASPARRVDFHVSRPTAVWWSRHRGRNGTPPRPSPGVQPREHLS